MRIHAIVVAFASIAISASAQGSPSSGIVRHPSSSQIQYANLALHVEGSHIVTSDGRESILRGINLGGWLVTETWMCGFTDSKDTKETAGTAGLPGRSTMDSLEERFGAERASSLMNSWQDHWITSRDLDEIRNDGFNLVRVPISYRTLQHADGSWILDARGQIDFSRMDWIVREAAERGIYTIFDLHVWPQQRQDQDKIGRADGRDIRESMARLWTVIATRYRGNGAIAAFDLINEFPGNWGVQQVLSRAVRAGDPDRVLVVEGFTFPEFMKLRAAGEFSNSVFSEHLYGGKPLTTEEFKSRLKEIVASPVPVYIGEFLAEDFVGAVRVMNSVGASWSPWTYKAVDMDNWAVFNYYSSLKVDIQRDTFEEINKKWSSDLTAWQTDGAPTNYFLNVDRSTAMPTEVTDTIPDRSQSNL